MVLGIDIRKMTFAQKLEAVSFGIGGLLLLIAVVSYVNLSSDMRPVSASLFIAGVMVMFLPYGLYSYFRDRAYSQMEKEFPAFLRNLSESIKSGMSMPEAFRQASRTNYGRLDAEVERASHQVSWGIPFPEVMNRLAIRVKGSDLIRRSVYILLQSYESGGNIAETLDAIAANTSRIKEAEKEKQAVLIQQVYVIYAIHFLFLGIIITLYLLLSGFLLEIGSTSASTGDAAGVSFGSVQNFCGPGSIAQPICSICPLFGLGDAGERICYYKSLFLLMILVEGVMNGIVAGEVLSSKISAGIKHSVLMGFLGIVIYVLALNVLG